MRFGVVDAADVGRLAAEHDLVVVSTGRGGWSDLFPRVPGRSLDAPRRLLSAGLYAGIEYPDPVGVTFARLTGARRADRDPAADLRGERDDAAVRGRAGRRSRGALAHAVRRRSRRLRAARAREAARALPARLRARRPGRVRPHPPEQHRAGGGHADRAGSPSRGSTTARSRSRSATLTSSSTRSSGRARTRRRSRRGRSARRSSREARSTRRSAAASTSGGFRSCSAPTTGRTS